MRRTRGTMYHKKIKIHKLAFEIVHTKDELNKKRLRTQLKRQNTILNNTIKIMAQPLKVKTII